jgi:hypothetical protein
MSVCPNKGKREKEMILEEYYKLKLNILSKRRKGPFSINVIGHTHINEIWQYCTHTVNLHQPHISCGI